MPTTEELIKAANDFDQQKVDISLSNAVGGSPEQSAKVYNLAREKNLPPGYVGNNYEQVSRPNTALLSPKTKELLADREKAKIAYDDLDNLSWWEKAAQAPGDVWGAMQAGYYSTKAGLAGTVTSTLEQNLGFGEIFLLKSLAAQTGLPDITEVGQKAVDYSLEQTLKAEEAFPKDPVLNEAVLGGVQSFTMNAPSLALGYLAKQPELPLAVMTTQSYGNAYIQGRRAGLSIPEARLFGLKQSGIEYVTEKIPVGKLFKDLEVGSGFFKTLVNQMVAEGIGEQAATFLQDFVEWKDLNPEKTVEEFRAERPQAAIDTLISTIVATGLQTSVISGIDRIARDKQVIDDMTEKAQESKLNQRSPELFQEHLKTLIDEYASADSLYIDASEVQTLFQDGTLNPEDYQEIQAQLSEAMAVGGDVVLPMEQIGKLVNSKNFEQLKPLLRVSPENQTPFENVQQMLDEASKNVELKTRADDIYKEIEQQLIQTGRMDKRTAKLSATLVPAYVTTTSVRTGLSVDEVYDMMGLKIVGPKTEVPQGRQILDQAKETGYTGESMGEALEWRRAYEKFGPEGMTTEARLKRAQEMGFDTERVFYHGTSEDISQFDPQKLGSSTQAFSAKEGFWLTSNPSEAGEYADFAGNEKALRDYTEKLAKLEKEAAQDPSKWDDYLDLQMQAERADQIKERGQNILPLFVNKSNLMEVDANGEGFVSNLVTQSIDQARKGGFQGVVFKNLSDSPYGASVADHVLVFNPADVRSVNAAFDPDYADSPLLLAQSEIDFFKEQGLITPEEEANLRANEDTRTTDQGIPGQQRPQAVVKQVYRGATQPLQSQDFQALGAATGHPSASLGVWFTSDQADASTYGEVQQHQLTLENPKSFSVEEDIPAFNTPEEYAQFREELQAQGHDGIVFDYSAVDGPVHYVAFEEISVGKEFFQSETTESDAFSKWFGDSKVVDDQWGDPLVVYHATSGDISQFDFSKLGQASNHPASQLGVFFGEIPDDQYTEGKDEANVIPAYLKIENPYEITSSEFQALMEPGKPDLYGAIDEVNEEIEDFEFFVGYSNEIGVTSKETGQDIDSDSLPEDAIEALAKLEEIADDFISYDPRDVFGDDSVADTFKALRERLIGEGYDGIIVNPDGMSEWPELNYKNYVVFRPNQIKSAIGNQGTFDPDDPRIYLQDEKKPRGSITFLPNESIIKLTEASDPSTFFHELGHLFLSMEEKLYNHPKVTPQIKADGEKVLEWLGAESFDKIGVEQHEQFARGFEKYLSEGKAPSVELQSAFRRFAAWIKQVYLDLLRLKVTLNDDIRGVMDRMLATDEAIARVGGDLKPLFTSADDAGMTETEYKNYTRQASPDAAKEALQKKLIKELQREYTKWWKDESAVVSNKVKKDLLKNPLYEVSEFLKGKHEVRNLEQVKLNRQQVKAQLGEVTPKFRNMTEDNGMDSDELAALFGFSSGYDMIDIIENSPTFAQEVKRLTQAEMLNRHGDILNDGTIEEEAKAALRNPEHAKQLLAELNALSRKTKTPAIDRAALKEYAKSKIGAMAYTKIKPSVYRNAEIKAAREAAVAKNKGDFGAAQKAKTQEILNFYLAREAQQVRDKAERNRQRLRAASKREYKDVHPNYATQIRALSNLYDFRKARSDDQSRALGQLQSIAQWMTAQENNPENYFTPTILDPNMAKILAQVEAGDPINVDLPSYKDMTADEIQAVMDQVDNLRYIGKQLSDEKKALFRERAKEAAQSIRDNAKKEVTVPQEPSQWDKKLSALREFGEDHIRLANQIAEMDGYKEFGPLFQDVYQKIIDASNVELRMKRETLLKLKEAFGEHRHSDLKEGKGEVTVNASSGKWTLSKRGRIMLGLYWGSPEGREAIRQGHGVTDSDVQNMLDTLEGKDVDLIESIWALNETFWPEVSRIHQKLKGVTLPKVDHEPFRIGNREVAGGYMRLFYSYDTKDSLRAAKNEDEMMTRTGNRLTTQTKHGARNARVGSGGRRMSWDLNNIFQALDETIHDVSFAETASDVTRFMRSLDVAKAIEDSYGKEKYQSMMSAISGVIAGNIQNNHYINSFMRKFRTAQTYAFLGYSIRNLVQQPIALTNMFGKLGEGKVINGLIEFYMHPKESIKFVQGKSEFMINRTAIVNRDSYEVMSQYSGQVMGSAWNTFKHHAFTLQTMGDASVAYPGWIAAYRDGIKKFGDEKKAVTYADEFVSSTIGSGLIKDQSPLLQGGGKISQAIGPEMLKGITFMGSYFNVVANLSRDAYKRADFRTVRGAAEYSRQMAWYLVLPALISAWIVGDAPDEDDDEGWAEWGAKTSLTYGLGQVFIVRDIASLINGYGPSSSYTRALDAVARVARDSTKIAEGEKDLDLETAAKLLRSAGNFTTIPGSGSAARTLEYIGSDEEFNPYKALVTGIER